MAGCERINPGDTSGWGGEEKGGTDKRRRASRAVVLEIIFKKNQESRGPEGDRGG